MPSHPLSPSENEYLRRESGARRVIRDRIGPALDAARERPGDAGRLHRLVKADELGVATVEVKDMDRFAGRSCFADHRDGIADRLCWFRLISTVGIGRGIVAS